MDISFLRMKIFVERSSDNAIIVDTNSILFQEKVNICIISIQIINSMIKLNPSISYLCSPPSELKNRRRPPFSKYCLRAESSSLLNISFGQGNTTKFAYLSLSKVISSLFLPHLYGPLYLLMIFLKFELGFPTSFFEELNMIFKKYNFMTKMIQKVFYYFLFSIHCLFGCTSFKNETEKLPFLLILFKIL